MTSYTAWVGGTSSCSRSYMGELGLYKMNPDQIRRWLPGYLEDAGYDVDTEAIWRNMSRDWDEKPEIGDLPVYSEVDCGEATWGAYSDQICGVEDENGEVIWSSNCDELEHVEEEEEEGTGPKLSTDLRDEHLEGVWLAYNFTEKGGWSAGFVLPEGEELDLGKLVFDQVEVDGLGEVINGISYNGEQLDIDCDSDGKGNDYYLVVDGEFYRLF